MIKKFFLNLLSSFIGAWLAIVLSGVVIALIIFALMGKLAMAEGDNSVKVKSNSVLVLNLEGQIDETETARQFDMNMLLSGEVEKPQTLLSLVTALREAAEDPRIEAVYVKCGILEISPATAHALHDALADYKKKTGRPVIAYSDALLQSALYVTSCADSIYLNPQGEVMLTGCGSVGLYLKDLFDKIGIQWQVAKVGTYKSAVEPYTTTEMSEPARRQLIELYDAVWRSIRKGIAEGRKISEAAVDSMTNSLAMTMSAEDVVKAGLVSATAYERQMDGIIGKAISVDADDINFIDAQAFGKNNAIPAVSGKHIAVLYATGEIQESAMAGINCHTLVPVITELAEDDDVTGLVLRVNSPGGSVFGSEQISEALAYFKSKKKPFVVSMGDYAASGGYWISCEADRIFADPMTITGSIGIFGLVPNGMELLHNIGVNPQVIATNPNALIAIPILPLNDTQMAALQTAITRGYNQFINKVAKGRHMSPANVDSIAQGRVWIGSKAKQLGLVDELGSLQKAIEYVASVNKDKNYEVGYYPRLTPSFWDYIPTAGSQNSPLGMVLNKSLGQQASPWLIWNLTEILKRNHRQAIMPSYWRVKI